MGDELVRGFESNSKLDIRVLFVQFKTLTLPTSLFQKIKLLGNSWLKSMKWPIIQYHNNNIKYVLFDETHEYKVYITYKTILSSLKQNVSRFQKWMTKWARKNKWFLIAVQSVNYNLKKNDIKWKVMGFLYLIINIFE